MTRVFVNGPSEQRLVHGTAVIAVFLFLWLFSLATPFVIVALLLAGMFKPALVLTGLASLCYSPWLPKSQGLRAWFRNGSERFHRNCSLTYEEPFAKADANGKIKKILCVHPHGIFCLGWGVLFTRPELDRVSFCFASALYASPFSEQWPKSLAGQDPLTKLPSGNS